MVSANTPLRSQSAIYALILGAVCLCSALAPASAQTVSPSQILPREIAPVTPQPAIELPNTDEGPSDTGQSTDYVLTVGSVEITGAFAEMGAANARLISAVSGRTLQLSQVLAATRELEREYAQAGYVFVRAIVPPQRIEQGGTIEIVIVDGWIEAIDLSALPHSVQVAVGRRLDRLIGRRHLRQTDLERALVLAGELGGLRLRSAISPGQQAGGVRLSVEGTLDRLEFGVDSVNSLPASLGGWQWNASATMNNLLGSGDRIYGLAGGRFKPEGYYLLGAGLILPIGGNGLSLSGDYLFARTRTEGVANIPATIGEFSRGQLALRLPLHRARRNAVDLRLGVDLITQNLHAPQFSIDINRDSYAALRLGLTAIGGGNRLSKRFGATFSQGISGRSATANLPYSRQGTNNNFSVLKGEFEVSSAIPGNFSLALTARGQTSFGKPLFVPEQFALDSEDAVSAFPGGSFSVDSGATLRAELALPSASANTRLSVAPYLFAAGGIGSLAEATASESSVMRAGAAGFGARIHLGTIGSARTSSVSFRLEVGRQFANQAELNGGHRANASVSLRF